MRFLITLLVLLFACPCAHAKEYRIYAALIENTRVTLADGGEWDMEKGDVFPVLMYKEMHTQIILQLDSTQFRTLAKNVRILKPDEVQAGLVSYQMTVENYRKDKAEKKKADNNPTDPALPTR